MLFSFLAITDTINCTWPTVVFVSLQRRKFQLKLEPTELIRMAKFSGIILHKKIKKFMFFIQVNVLFFTAAARKRPKPNHFLAE